MYLLRATFEDGRELVADVDGRDIRRWEAANKGQSFLDGTTYTQLHDLAWMALDRTRAVEGMTKAEYDLRCVLVKEETAQALDPTEPAPTDVPSSP